MNGEIKIHPFINTLWIIPEDLIVQLPDREEERPPDIMQWRDGAKKAFIIENTATKLKLKEEKFETRWKPISQITPEL